MEPRFELGDVWSIGVGSVGSCALFFLGLITRNFRAVLVDRDNVEIENVTRSALFSWRDALREASKVDVAACWLREARVEQIEPLVAWLHEIPDHWTRRPTGTPDLLISAANERNVRSVIEGSHPPLQMYATTGQNWQSDTIPTHPARRCLFALCAQRRGTSDADVVCNRIPCP